MKNKLVFGLKKSGGRTLTGRLTNFCHGGGVKRKYRFIDFKRTFTDWGYVQRIERDPCRSGFIAVAEY